MEPDRCGRDVVVKQLSHGGYNQAGVQTTGNVASQEGCLIYPGLDNVNEV